MRVFEAQEQAEKDAKARAEGKAEFDAEQEYLKTLSYLSPEEQKRYTERQGVSFMYQKPPGYDAAMSKAAEQVGFSRIALLTQQLHASHPHLGRISR